MPIRRLAAAASLLLTALISPALAEPVRYDDHVYMLVSADDPAEIEAVGQFGINLSCRVGPGLQPMIVHRDLVEQIEALGLPSITVSDNVQDLVDAERAQMERTRADRDAAFFTTFRRYAEISQFIDDTVALNPAIATRVSVGQSLENREIFAIRITGPGDPTGRPVFVVQGCQHAREWGSPSSVCWAIEQLVVGYGVDSEITELVDGIDWHIIPLVNPDGYEYSHTTERFWRKNRRNNGDGTSGVDLNRNWSFQWGGAGSSGSTSSEIYRGPAPFSEPETSVVSSYIQALGGTVSCIGDCSAGNRCSNVKAHLDIHTFSQVLLGPWGYTTQVVPPRAAELVLLQDEMAAAMTSEFGVPYTAGLGTEGLLGIADGISPDWSFAELGALAWTYELRPGPGAGLPGFDLPASEIVPVGTETFAGIKALANRLISAELVVMPTATLPVFPSGSATTLETDVFSAPSCLLDVGGASLFYREAGAPSFIEVPLADQGDGRFAGSIPAQPCGTNLEYYFEAISLDGQTVVTEPAGGAAAPILAQVLDVAQVFGDNFENDLGWTVENSNPLGDGAWERGVPVGNGDRGDPATDADGSGACFLTDNVDGNSDVDGGSTTLVSPVLDASDPTSEVVYFRWYDNSFGAAPGTKTFEVEVSDDAGGTWEPLETVGPTGDEVSGGWFRQQFRIADIPNISNTSQFQIRFTASDGSPASVVEAGVDGVEILTFACVPTPCLADINGDGTTDVFDFSDLAANFGAGPGATFEQGDITGDGFVDVFDFAELTAEFGCVFTP